jgi:hypothetical protein
MSFLIKYATSAVTFIKESVAIPFNVSDEFVNRYVHIHQDQMKRATIMTHRITK